MIKSITGTKDILPEDIQKWIYLENIVHSIMSNFNYKEINPIFKQLPGDIKSRVYSKLVLLSGKLDVFHIDKLIDKAMYNLENKQRTEASSIYKQVSQIYKDITPKFKPRVLERCNELHKKLSSTPIKKT